MTRLWGLKTCDACRRARQWLESHHINFLFHDVRETVPTPQQLKDWLEAVGPDVLVNRRSATWRALPEAAKSRLESGDVIPVLADHLALLKRPILEYGSNVVIGFSVDTYKKLTGKIQ